MLPFQETGILRRNERDVRAGTASRSRRVLERSLNEGAVLTILTAFARLQESSFTNCELDVMIIN